MMNKTEDYKGFDKVFYYTIIFLISSFIGYIYEVIYFLIDDKVLVNRGFFYGPYIPVYGFGALFLIITLKRFKSNPLIVFLLAMLVTGITEYTAGVWVDKVYHEMWWDYRGVFLNINGYVCFRSVLSFAVGALMLIYWLEPLVCRKIMPIKCSSKKVIFAFIVCTVTIDLVFTLIFRHPL